MFVALFIDHAGNQIHSRFTTEEYDAVATWQQIVKNRLPVSDQLRRLMEETALCACLSSLEREHGFDGEYLMANGHVRLQEWS